MQEKKMTIETLSHHSDLLLLVLLRKSSQFKEHFIYLHRRHVMTRWWRWWRKKSVKTTKLGCSVLHLCYF
ncbi:hypothetical protein Leryth_013885, partial [Lithospermum erythrorhizon]